MTEGIDWSERLTVQKEKMTTLPIRPSMRKRFKEIMRLNGFKSYEQLFLAFIQNNSVKLDGGAK